jgi:hypothetical protein
MRSVQEAATLPIDPSSLLPQFSFVYSWVRPQVSIRVVALSPTSLVHGIDCS